MSSNGQSRTQQNEIISAMEKEWGKTAFARTPMGLVVCRKPTPGEHTRLQDKLGDTKKSDSNAIKEFVFAAVVHPDPDGFRSVMDEYPVLVEEIAVAMRKLAGGDIEVETGK